MGSGGKCAGDGIEPSAGWGRIYGLLATTCGYSYPVIDAMTLLDVEELTRYWINHPPLHLMVAAYFGVGEVGKRTRSSPLVHSRAARAENSEIGAVLAELGPGFAGRDVHVGLAPVVLDFGQLKGTVRDRYPSAAR